MWRGIVFHVEGPATAKALSPFCVLAGGTTRRVLSDAERVTGPCSGLDFIHTGCKSYIQLLD